MFFCKPLAPDGSTIPMSRLRDISELASPRWAIGELTTALKAREIEKAREMATQLVPFWSRVAPGEERRDFLGRTLAVAGGVQSPAVAASLLEPFTLERLTRARQRGWSRLRTVTVSSGA